MSSRNFRSNLKNWFNKIINHNKIGKKQLLGIVNTIGTSNAKDSKSTLQQKILQFLYKKVTQLKQSNSLLPEAIQLITSFLSKHQLSFPENLRELLNNQIQKYANNIDESERNNIELISNIIQQDKQSYECICIKSIKDLQFEELKEVCYKCGRYCHVNCMWNKDSKDQVYQCPMCFLIHSIPNKDVKQLIFAGYMRQYQRDKIQHQINFQVQDQRTQNFNIEVRCVRLSKQTRYELTWPSDCTIRLNGQKMADFRPLNINSSFKRRFDEQLVLDRKHFKTTENSLLICERHQYNQQHRQQPARSHLIVILATQKLTTQQTIYKMNKDSISLYESKEHYLRTNLNIGIKDVSIDKFKISLKCPFFFDQKITMPVRSKHCISHYHPFDLKGFVKANSMTKVSPKKWKCPYCSKRAYHMIVDLFLLRQIRSNPHLNELQCSLNMFNDLQSNIQQIQDEGQKIQIIDELQEQLSSFYHPINEDNIKHKQQQIQEDNSIINIMSDQSIIQESIIQCIDQSIKLEDKEEVEEVVRSGRRSNRKRKGDRILYREYQTKKTKKQKKEEKSVSKEAKKNKLRQIKLIDMSQKSKKTMDCDEFVQHLREQIQNSKQDNQNPKEQIQNTKENIQNPKKKIQNPQKNIYNPKQIPIISQAQAKYNQAFIKCKLSQLNRSLPHQNKSQMNKQMNKSQYSMIQQTGKKQIFEKGFNISKQKSWFVSTTYNSRNQQTINNKTIQLIQEDAQPLQQQSQARQSPVQQMIHNFIEIEDSQVQDCKEMQQRKIRNLLYELQLQKDNLKVYGNITKEDQILFVSLCQKFMINQFHKIL